MLSGYGSLSLGRISSGRLFQTINFVGAVAFIVNGAYHGALPSVAVNVAWAAISVVALLRAARARRSPPPPLGAPHAGARPLDQKGMPWSDPSWSKDPEVPRS